MRLKSIKLAGFKSFVDPTTIPFPSNLAAIVGPNGCGKSNTIDAVRWVMGESSAKNLRGESMADVIFNGSQVRKPVNQCSVELVFDNSDATLLGPWAEYSEISVKRKVTRDADNAYFINGTKCRRRDVTDLFAGTGLGPRSYAIIEQGMISRLIESKPHELRVYIEEAAGITKYKDRRRETENRMRRTQENLERLTDIRDELGRQIEKLRRQAEAAEKYKLLKSEERQTRTELSVMRWQALNKQVESALAEVKQFELEIEAVNAKLTRIDADSESLRFEQQIAADAYQKVQERYYRLGNEASRLEQQIMHQNQQLSSLQADLNRQQQALQQQRESLKLDQEQLQEEQAHLDQLLPELEQLDEEEGLCVDQLEKQEQRLQEVEQQWLKQNTERQQWGQRVQLARQRIDQKSEHLRRQRTQIERLQQQIQELPSEGDSAVTEDLHAEQEQLSAFLFDLEERQEQLQIQLEQGAEDQERQSLTLKDKQVELRDLSKEVAAMKALLSQSQQQTEQSLRPWLEQLQLNNFEMLEQLVLVDSTWQKSVSFVLAHRLQGVKVKSLPSALDISLPAHSAFIIEEPHTSRQYDSQSIAAIMEAPAAIRDMFAQVFVCDLDQLDEQRCQLADGQSLLTAEGLWCGRDWMYVAGSDTQSNIGLKQQYDSCYARLDELEVEVEDLELMLQQRQLNQSQLVQQQQQLQQQVGARQLELSQVQAQIARHEEAIYRDQQQRQHLTQEISEAEALILADQEELDIARMELAEAELTMDMPENESDDLQAERDQLRMDLGELRGDLEKIRQQKQSLILQKQRCELQIESLNRAQQRAAQTQEERQLDIERLREACELARDPDNSLQIELDELLQKRIDLEEEVQKQRTLAESAQEKLHEFDLQRHNLYEQQRQLESQQNERRLEMKTLETRQSTIEEQLREQNISLQHVISQLVATASIDEWEQKIESLNQRITRLGPINLAAVEEFEQQSQRKQYLDAQHEDLMAAMQTLETAIKKIDRETRDRFKETFDRVNAGLSELFPKVFGGGNAWLALTDDDLLETGVAIMARPPGKKNSTIHLLSGGEKALTAIALVFSIFRLNPAPFCMLDEVDAPLDDANVGRYAKLVEAMSERVQFIYITHNKIAMEMASQLMGVTMNEPGVSRLVSVDVNDAVELVAS